MEEQSVTNNPIQQSNIPTPTEPKHHSFLTSKLFLITLAILIFFTIIYAGIYLYLGSQLDQISKPAPTLLPAETSVKEGDPTANWKTYIIKAVDLEFKLPPKLEVYGELKEEIIVASSPWKESELTVTFKDKTQKTNETAPIRLGTISIDYNVGRGAGFTDYQGFEIENNKYYAKLLQTRFEIPIDSLTVINNPYGITILKIKGKYTTGENGETEGVIVPGTPGDIGALINTSNKIYPGIVVVMHLNGILNENDFNQILSTFKFTN